PGQRDRAGCGNGGLGTPTMSLEELQRAQSAIRDQGVDVTCIASIANLPYVTGVEVALPVGAGFEMAYAPWLAVVSGSDAGLVSGRAAGGMGGDGHVLQVFTA